MSIYSIKDLEHLSGIKAHTIRIWEQRYNLFSPQRTDTNIRFYSDEDLKQVLNISVLKNHGFKISRIVQMSPSTIQEEVVKLNHEEHSYEDQINALTVAMLDMDESFFNSIIQKNQEKIGLESLVIDVLYPFFRKIGILWMANSINPAQEHFVSNLVRQKLIVETSKVEPRDDAPTFMLFLPESELHELGLLFANYLLRTRGVKTFYLGQSVPTRDLEEVFHKINPDYLFSIITSKPNASDVESYILELARKFRDTKIFLTGNQVVDLQMEMPANIINVDQIGDLDLVLQNSGVMISE